MNSESLNQAKSRFLDGIKFFNEKNYELAEKNFLESLKLAPQRISVIGNLIKIYVVTKQIKKLSEILAKYKKLNNEKEILFGKAYNFFFNENFDESIKICNQIINNKDIKYPIQDLLASNFKNKGNFLQTLKIYKNKLLENKKDYKVYYNIGCLLLEIGKNLQAIFYFKKSKKLNQNNPDINWRLSLCFLAVENFKDGFILYEDRWKRENHPVKKFKEIKLPTHISEIKNKKVLVWDEQGLGDTLQFSRFVIDLIKYTDQITFVVNKKLKGILSNLNTNILVKDYEDLNKLDFDFQIPICSLPKYLSISKKEDFNFYKLKLPEIKNKYELKEKEKLSIGITWSGNPNYLMDKYRSISFEKIKQLLKIKDINFYQLSKNIKQTEFIDYNSYKNLIDIGNKSLFEIASMLKELDLVISSDTSIIHLAGILEIKSILLLSYNADWRWFNDNKNTIWYPSVEIIRQKKFNVWDDVFENLLEKIQKKRAV